MKFIRDVWANKRCSCKVKFLKSNRQCRRRSMGFINGIPFCSQHGKKFQR